MRRVVPPVFSVFLSLCIALGALGGGTPTAHGYQLNGCKSSKLERNRAEHYRTGQGIGDYYDWAVGRAARAWNNRKVPGALYRTANGGDIIVRRYSYSHDWYAVASWSCTSYGYYHGSRSITLNRRTMDPLAKWKDRFLIIHEFGHVMGLGHTSSGCGVSIMRGDAQTGNGSCWNKYPPWGDDVRGMKAVY